MSQQLNLFEFVISPADRTGSLEKKTSVSCSNIPIEENDEDVVILNQVKSIALRRFPKLGPGERIGIREIKQRLLDIRNSGWYVKPYNSMNREEALKYLRQLQMDIRASERTPSYFNR